MARSRTTSTLPDPAGGFDDPRQLDAFLDAVRWGEAVREAYALDEEREPQICEYKSKIASDTPLPAWREIDLAHGFHETPQSTRFTIALRPGSTS